MSTAAPLVFNGTPIRPRGEMLNLTDCWRAGGADPSKRPAAWLRGAEAVEFREHLETVRNSHSLIQTEEGRDGGTWAHWQLALAYAKYLSPEFHVWCNKVVRAYMEGEIVAGADTLTCDESRLPRFVLAALGELRGDLNAALAMLRDMSDNYVRREDLAAIRVILDRFLPRREPSKATQVELCRLTALFGGRCPACSMRDVLDRNGNPTGGAEFDHFFARNRNGLSEMWIVCKACHDAKTGGADFTDTFRAFHSKRKAMPGAQVIMFEPERRK